MITKKHALAISAAVAGIGSSVVAFPEPASAHNTGAAHGNAEVSVYNQHRVIRICAYDHGRAYYYRSGSGTLYGFGVTDGCNHQTPASRVTRFQVCSDTGTWTCSSWKTA